MDTIWSAAGGGDGEYTLELGQKFSDLIGSDLISAIHPNGKMSVIKKREGYHELP